MARTRKRDRFPDEGLTAIVDDFQTSLTTFVREYPWMFWIGYVLVIVLILSPLIMGDKGKDWSETIKNVVESAALLAAAFAVIQWVNERRDRSTDILLKLDEQFRNLGEGRLLVELRARLDLSDVDNMEKVDKLLRFYVVLYGVLIAKQVPERSLSICFRYWLTFYYHRERTWLRDYIDNHYPTLQMWLREDARRDGRFFSPARLLRDNVDADLVRNLRNLKE
jgi:hypothetical protein